MKDENDGTASRPLEPDVQTDSELANAIGIVEGLQYALKEDLGAAFGESVLRAIAVVRDRSPGTWECAKGVLRTMKVSIREVQNASAKYRVRNLRIVPSGTSEDTLTAGSLLGEDCPTPDLVIPGGFDVNLNATTKAETVKGADGESTTSEVVIAHAPILIAARLRDIESGAESLDLRFRRPEGWHQMIVDRGVALDARQITQLASRGFPVSSATAKDLVQYLHDLEGLNYQRIPVTHSTSHFGWQGKDGELGFLCGRRLVLPDGRPAPLQGPEDGSGPEIVFVGIASGDDQIADSIYVHGSYDGWVSAIELAVAYPRVLLGLYASFVPPLLRILGAPNVMIDWWNRTTTGKTTALRLAASVWGSPDEHAPDSFISGWDATEVFIERACSVLTGLPLLLDETKRAKNPALVGKILYGVAQGRGRSRGNVKSIARTGSWRTVLLSTGESRATGFTQDGGTRARVLEIGGYPFVRADKETGDLVNKLNAALRANFGHAGPLFVQWLVENKDLWDTLVESYHSAITRYSEMLPEDCSRIDPAVVNRLSHCAAAIQVAAECAHEALNLPWGVADPLETIWHEIVANTGEAPGDERALRDVVSWAHSNRETFCGGRRSNGQSQVPSGGWSGRWDLQKNWEHLAFHPHLLKKVLGEFGFEPEAVFAGWKERGWLDVGKGRGFDKSVRVGKENPCLIVIRRAAVDAIER
jgi:putative DNA primase/helicase